MGGYLMLQKSGNRWKEEVEKGGCFTSSIKSNVYTRPLVPPCHSPDHTDITSMPPHLTLTNEERLEKVEEYLRAESPVTSPGLSSWCWMATWCPNTGKQITCPSSCIACTPTKMENCVHAMYDDWHCDDVLCTSGCARMTILTYLQIHRLHSMPPNHQTRPYNTTPMRHLPPVQLQQ